MRLFAAIVLAAGLTTAACGDTGAGSILDKETLVVGVRPDLPSLGFKRPDGTFEGFDVDVARYVARYIGKDIRFAEVLAAERIPALTSKKADLVLATLSVTPERKTKIAYAGPYYTSYQDVMVRKKNTRAKTVRDLRGRRFCAVRGASPTRRLIALHGMTADLLPARDYDQCMRMIGNGAVDAITTNDVILAGLIKRYGGTRLLNVKLSEQNTGIGIRQGDPDGCVLLNRAITRMYQDGTARELVTKWFGGTGLDLMTEVPQFEGCD